MQMRFRQLSIRVGLATLGCLCGAGTVAYACNVPVFRYALEHWRPDAYRAVLFHRGPLTAADAALQAELTSQQAAGHLNLQLRTVDLAGRVEAADRELLATQSEPPLPWLVLQYPAALRLDHPVWSGRFAAAEVAGLVDSPARQELLRRLAAGQTAVWLLLECGDAAQDSAAAERLEAELQRLQQTLKLPELTDAPEDAILREGPALRVEFSHLRIRRDAPAERALVALLLAAEPDLATTAEPMVFPVFGRSRALLPLVGPGISGDNIRSSAAFLSGACSCQVKELNPGFDLLLSADWNGLLPWAKLPAVPSAGDLRAEPREPELVAIPPGSQPAPRAAEATGVSRPAPAAASTTGPQPPGNRGKLLLIFGACLASAAVAWLVLRGLR